MPANDRELEVMADKVARTIYRNWYLIDSLMESELHIKLSKREAITVARRALEMMEEKQL